MKNTGHIEVDTFKFRYLTEGNGPDTLVIGSSLYYSRSFSQNLRKSLRLHFIDHRGFAEPPTHGIDEVSSFNVLLDDIEQIRQKLSLKKCIVVGHSANGRLALEYAKKYKEHLSYVVLIGTPPNMGPDNLAMAARNWDESVWPERKAAFEQNMKIFSNEELGKLPRDQQFFQMNARNAPKNWYDYRFDSSFLWQGVKPNIKILDQMHLQFGREIDISKRLDSLGCPVMIAYGRFDFAVPPVQSWDLFRPKFKDLTVCIFERSSHSPHYEEASLFDEELLKWLDAHG